MREHHYNKERLIGEAIERAQQAQAQLEAQQAPSPSATPTLPPVLPPSFQNDDEAIADGSVDEAEDEPPTRKQPKPNTLRKTIQKKSAKHGKGTAPDESRTTPPKARKNKQTGRLYTTIAKVIFTQFKRLLRDRKCPVDMRPYFAVCAYDRNHRTLMDFEVPTWYAQQKGAQTFAAFKQYLTANQHTVLASAERKYGGQPKLQTFKSYFGRILAALTEGSDSKDRMGRLYCIDIGHLNSATENLREIQAQFKFAN
jgi:hypothetical protein